MTGAVTLVLGGTRSGKSAWAEALTARTAAALRTGVSYVATAPMRADDADHQARIAAHRDRRPATWQTIECPNPVDLPDALAAASGVVLLDSLGTWVAGHRDFAAVDPDPLVAAFGARTAPTVVVSEEVGLSIHPPTELGRHFVDALGRTNQAVSARAERAVLIVAGRALELPAPEDGS